MSLLLEKILVKLQCMFRWLILANTLSFISFFNSFSRFSDISGIFYFVISPKTQKHSKTMIKSKLFCCLVISEFFFKVTMTKSISIQESYLKFFFRRSLLKFINFLIIFKRHFYISRLWQNDDCQARDLAIIFVDHPVWKIEKISHLFHPLEAQK